MKTILGGFLLFAGLIAIAGSAGDCDGECMEYANTFGEMLIALFIGLTLVVTGGIIIYSENK
jgi:hypothetical protein